MSLHELIPNLSLVPASHNNLLSPFSLSSYWRLLRWVLWDPAALEQYIADHVISKAVTDVAPLPLRTWDWRWSAWNHWWQARATARTFLSYLLTAISTILILIEFAAVLMTLTILPPRVILSNLFFSAAIGMVMFILFFVLVGFLADELTPATIWSTYYGLGLPLLFLHEMWMRDRIAHSHVWFLVEFNLICGLLFGFMLNSVTSTLAYRFSDTIFARRIFHLMAWGFGILFFFVMLLYDRPYVIKFGVGVIASCIAFALVMVAAAMFRLDDFLLAYRRLPDPERTMVCSTSGFDAFANRQWEEQLWHSIPRVTYISPPQLSLLLEDWLEQNWVQGIKNAYQLWRYTNLQHMVIRTIQKVLQETPPSELLKKIEEMRIRTAESGGKSVYSWHLEEFIDEPRSYATLKTAIRNQFRAPGAFFTQYTSNQPKSRKVRRQEQKSRQFAAEQPLVDNRQIDAPWQAALAGFVHMQTGLPQQAAEAFAKVKGSDYATELSQINQALAYLIHNENLVHVGPILPLPEQPEQAQHKSTWEALIILQEIVHHAWLYRRCQPAKQEQVRQQIEKKIQQLLNRGKQFDEDTIIERLTRLWQAQLQAWFAEAETLKLKEVSLPYCYTEPLRTIHTFQGRKYQLQEIKQAWTPGRLQTLLLYGQPMIGKTSLLYNAAIANSQSVALAIVNVALLNRGTDVITRLCMSICIEVERAVLHTASNIDILEQHLSSNPYHFIHNYIRDMCQQLGNRVLIIALDNIEALFLLQNPTKTNSLAFSPTPAAFDSFMNTLWHLSHHVHNLTFFFVTKYMPEQLLSIAQDIFNAARPLKVDYLNEGDVKTLLQRPTPNFLPRFTQNAITFIYQLTAGQPFLVQLVGSCLVQYYNQQIKTKYPLDPVFSRSDIEKVVARDSEFIRQSDVYFARLWRYLKTVNPDHELILRTLVTKPAGCSYDEINAAVIGANAKSIASLQQQLQFLQNYEVIYSKNSKWFIKMELLERWGKLF
ncbi:MAG: hypothetical protein R3C14_35350 [Caldilineaceae bacterium]